MTLNAESSRTKFEKREERSLHSSSIPLPRFHHHGVKSTAASTRDSACRLISDQCLAALRDLERSLLPCCPRPASCPRPMRFGQKATGPGPVQPQRLSRGQEAGQDQEGGNSCLSSEVEADSNMSWRMDLAWLHLVFDIFWLSVLGCLCCMPRELRGAAVWS